MIPPTPKVLLFCVCIPRESEDDPNVQDDIVRVRTYSPRERG